MTALVSICIPTFNGARFIGETIQSVLDQSYHQFELLIFDDGSADNTAEICQSFDDPRIQFKQNEKNLGPKENWDQCLKYASGQYFKLLPHDDLLEPGTLERQVKILSSRPDVALVFGTKSIINETGKILLRRKPLGDEARSIDGFELVRETLKAGNNLIGEPGSGLFRSALIDIIGAYDDTNPYTIDLDYWFRILAHGNAYYTAAPASRFRIHGDSWSAEIGKLQYRDFVGTMERFEKDAMYQIDPKTVRTGKLKAWLSTQARRVIFRKYS
ncbi:MAG: glycosyltransferase [Hellea sp.]|nr:glycosyltransferase [Hellea sp.]